jgi:PAS domain S-box-containing protein
MVNTELAKFYLEGLLSTIGNAVTIVNENGIVMHWNKSAEKMYDIKSEEIINKDIRGFFSENNLKVLNVLENEDILSHVYHRPRFDKHVLLNASPLYDDLGALIGAITIEHDMTNLLKKDNDNYSDVEIDMSEWDHAEIEESFSIIKGKSPLMLKTIQVASQAARSDATILITGESGVGKELFVQAIHQASGRRNENLIPINCGAIPSELFESELFGYEGGAYTGASKSGKIGKIELANKGTLFLDEVGELPAEMQVKLLRVLQEREVYRIGGIQPIKVDIRVIAATNQNLEDMVSNGSFRSDLYFRLNVISLEVPPLRERKEDIPELIQHHLIELAKRHNKNSLIFTPESLQVFIEYNWPGNIRELSNLVERVVVLGNKERVDYNEVLKYFPTVKTKNVSIYNTKDEHVSEKRRILNALQDTYGNKTAAAKKLGMSRGTLYKKIKQYGLFNQVK